MENILSQKPLRLIRQANKARKLRELVVAQVLASPAEGILFSGGLDTSVLASIAAAYGRRLKAVMVSVSEGTGLDEPFAVVMAGRLGIGLEVLRPTLNELLDRMPKLVGILHTFDPMELRNSIVTYVAMEAALGRELKSLLTGDGADELFAGYRYMFTMPRETLLPYARHLNEIMHFTSPVIGRELGIIVQTPFIADEIRSFAMSLSYADLVGDRQGQRLGKKILREAFSDLLPDEIAWRVKTPLENGSGSTGLKGLAEQLVSETEYERERQRIAQYDSVRLRDREQFFYYRIYRSLFGPPSELDRTSKACSECHAPLVRSDMTYCRTCGAYPI